MSYGQNSTMLFIAPDLDLRVILNLPKLHTPVFLSNIAAVKLNVIGLVLCMESIIVGKILINFI